MVGEPPRINRRQAGRIDLDHPGGDRPVGRLVGDGPLDDQDRLLGRIDPDARELPEAERRRPERVEDQEDRPVERDDGRRPLVVEPSAAVPRVVFFPGTRVQRPDDAPNGDGLAVEPVDPPADRTLEPPADPDALGLADRLGIREDDDGIAAPLADQLGQEDRPVARGAAPDIIAQVGQDDRLPVGGEGEPDRLLGARARDQNGCAGRPRASRRTPRRRIGRGRGRRRRRR